MRPVSLVSFDELTEQGNKELNQILSKFVPEEENSPSFVDQEATRYEWSAEKPLIFSQHEIMNL